MGGIGLDELEHGGAAPSRRGAARRWLAWRGEDGPRSSGRLESTLELRAERTDDGVLVAPLGHGGQRIVWVADMGLEPLGWPGRSVPPRFELAAPSSAGPGAEITWQGLTPGRYRLRFTVLCRPEGHLTFQNDAFDDAVDVSQRDGRTSLVLRPYEGMPGVEVSFRGEGALAGGASWERGVEVVELDGCPGYEDRFSPGHVEVAVDGGELSVSVRVLEDEGSIAGKRRSEPDHAWVARPGWAAAFGASGKGELAEELSAAANSVQPEAEPVLQALRERAGSRPVWDGLEGLCRWDERHSSDAPVAVEHAAQLVALLGRCAGESAASAREARASVRWFREGFWLSTPRRLADRCLSRGARGRASLGLRPHMLLATALPGVPLRREERRAVLDVVAARLVTDLGLRSLDPEDALFDGRSGSRGATWPWLVAPLARTAVLSGGVDRLRLRRLAALALGADRAPEVWFDGPAPGTALPAGQLIFAPNRWAAVQALDALAGAVAESP